MWGLSVAKRKRSTPMDWMALGSASSSVSVVQEKLLRN
jgi:hypothetical protein